MTLLWKYKKITLSHPVFSLEIFGRAYCIALVRDDFTTLVYKFVLPPCRFKLTLDVPLLFQKTSNQSNETSIYLQPMK